MRRVLISSDASSVSSISEFVVSKLSNWRPFKLIRLRVRRVLISGKSFASSVSFGVSRSDADGWGEEGSFGLRVNRIFVLQCGQVTEAIFGTRSNEKSCLHFVQATVVIFDLDEDIGTQRLLVFADVQ